MSLQNEKVLLESKINGLKKDRMLKTIEADMSILALRNESSPLLSIDQIDIDKIEVAVAKLREYIEAIGQIDKEIARLEKILG